MGGPGRASIVECVMGVFGFGEENELVDRIFFPKDPRRIAERLRMMESGKLVDELVKLIKRLKEKGYRLFVFERPDIARAVREELEVETNVSTPSKAGEMLRGNLGEFAQKVGFVEEPHQIREWIRRVSIELTKMKVRMAVEKRDLVAAQIIQMIDDLDKALNLFMSRIREWYGLHFPELNRLVDKHETYARLVAHLGVRENFTVENLVKEGLPKAKSEHIFQAAQTSMGAELSEADIQQIQTMCRSVLELYSIRRSLETYIDSVMGEVAPNLRALVGPLLGARLIALAGGLDSLAKMPASTIQVLGAEKALFRALRTGTRPPKHGIIFQHPFIRDAKRWQRGKISRALAGKLAIAARTDAFGGKYIGDELREDLERRVLEIQERYREPPPRKARPRKGRRGKRGRKS